MEHIEYKLSLEDATQIFRLRRGCVVHLFLFLSDVQMKIDVEEWSAQNIDADMDIEAQYIREHAAADGYDRCSTSG